MIQVQYSKFEQYRYFQSTENLFLDLIKQIDSEEIKQVVEEMFLHLNVNKIDEKDLLNQINSDDILEQINGLHYLTKQRIDQINLDFARQITPSMIQILETQRIRFITYQCVFILSNLPYQFQPIIIQNQGIRALINLLNNSNSQIINQSIWALRNIFCNYQHMLQHFVGEILSKLLELIEKSIQLQKSINKQLLAELCPQICLGLRFDKIQKVNLIQKAIETIPLLIYKFPEEEIIFNLVTSLDYLFDLKITCPFFQNVISQMVLMINDSRVKVSELAVSFLYQVIQKKNGKFIEQIIKEGFFESIYEIVKKNQINPKIAFQVLRSIYHLSERFFSHPLIIKYHNFFFEQLLTAVEKESNPQMKVLKTLERITKYMIDKQLIVRLLDIIEKTQNKISWKYTIIKTLNNILEQNGIHHGEEYTNEDQILSKRIQERIRIIREIYQ